MNNNELANATVNNFICNAFSIQMLGNDLGNVMFEDITPDQVPTDAVSAIGHADTASVISSILGREVKTNRANIVLDDNTVLYIAQLIGGRLPEGATTLPEGFTLKWVRAYRPQIIGSYTYNEEYDVWTLRPGEPHPEGHYTSKYMNVKPYYKQ